MPNEQEEADIPVIGTGMTDDSVITLSGQQLKCLIKDFAKEAIRVELAKAVKRLTGTEDEEDDF